MGFTDLDRSLIERNGGYPLAHRAGAVVCRWLPEETLGRPVGAHNDWQDSIQMLRHDQSIFLEAGGRR